VAKVVVLRSGDQFLLAVLPAARRLDLERLRALAGDPQLRMAREGEFAGVFAACELGAIPPIRELWGLPVWVDDALGREAETVFSAGNHREAVHVAYQDFVRLAQPTFGEFSMRTARSLA
jgi:Ala-tRNA(Pro) deacylase